MELLQLKYFCDAAREENFSKTAGNFGVPPSDISQTIKRLENELSVKLFVRYANRISLTDKGAEFYKKVSEALGILSNAVAEVTDDRNEGKLNICVNTNRRVVMNVVERFKKQYPNIDIRAKFFSDPTDETFDIIISNEDKRLKNYKATTLLSEGLAIAISRENPLAAREHFDVEMLSNEPFITLNEQSSLYELTRKICADFGFTPHIAVQSDDPFYIRKCVELGLGVALVPLFSWKGQFAENVVLKPINGYTRTTYAYTDSKKYTPLCAQRFLELLSEECSQSK